MTLTNAEMAVLRSLGESLGGFLSLGRSVEEKARFFKLIAEAEDLLGARSIERAMLEIQRELEVLEREESDGEASEV